jgi:hypothetical protein
MENDHAAAPCGRYGCLSSAILRRRRSARGEPFTGEGIYYALHSGELAAHAHALIRGSDVG